MVASGITAPASVWRATNVPRADVLVAAKVPGSGRAELMIIDLVVNHTSNQHPWFQEARRDAESKYRDWYVWSKKRPKNARDGVVFPGVQKSTWSYDEEARMWYFHRFYDFQPDLNTSHPDV